MHMRLGNAQGAEGQGGSAAARWDRLKVADRWLDCSSLHSSSSCHVPAVLSAR